MASLLVDKDKALAECERLWTEESDVAGVLAAVKLCAENGWPLPAWCKRPVMGGLRLLAKKGARGKRSPDEKLRSLAAHQRRHNLVMLERGKGKTRKEAFAAVAKREQHATEDTIRNSYRKILRRRRALNKGN